MAIHPHPTFEPLAEVQRGCAMVAGIPEVLTAQPEGDLTGLFAHLMQLRALAEGAALAVLTQAQERGVVGASDRASPAQWVRGVAAQQAEVIVPTGLASAMVKTAAAAGAGHGADAGGARIAQLAVAGRIGAQQAAPIVREFAAMRRKLPAQVWDAACEAMIEFVADGATPKQVAAAHEAIVASYGDEGELEQTERVRRDLRSFGEFRPDRVGMYTATLRLDPESYARVEAVISAHCRPDPLVRDERGNPVVGDPRDREQRRADALVDILGSAGTDPTRDSGRPGTAARAQLLVTFNAADLANDVPPRASDRAQGSPESRDREDATATETDTAATEAAKTSKTAETGKTAEGRAPTTTARAGHGVTEHGQPVPATFLRRLACHADITPVVLDQGGSILWAGRRFRFATARQLAALYVRDRGCSFPGCDRPPSWCEAHHIRHWIDGGPTDIDNLALLCERHHHVVHMHGYGAAATTRDVTWHIPASRHARTPRKPAAAPTDLLTRLHDLRMRAGRHDHPSSDPAREPPREPPDDRSPIAG